MRAAPEPTIEVRGATAAAVDLKRLGDRGSDIRRVSEKVRAVYRRSNEQRFGSGGAGSWPPLAPATKEKKAREGLDPRPLRETGALYRSLTSPRVAGQIDERDPTEFRFGTTLPYAYVQTKTRDLIELTASDRKQVTDLISGYISRAQA